MDDKTNDLFKQLMRTVDGGETISKERLDKVVKPEK